MYLIFRQIFRPRTSTRGNVKNAPRYTTTRAAKSHVDTSRVQVHVYYVHLQVRRGKWAKYAGQPRRLTRHFGARSVGLCRAAIQNGSVPATGRGAGLEKFSRDVIAAIRFQICRLVNGARLNYGLPDRRLAMLIDDFWPVNCDGRVRC